MFPVSGPFLDVEIKNWKKGPSCTGWISYSPLFLFARSVRTCKRRCQCSSMINILCTAFWVPSRVIHITRCSQHPESSVLTLDCTGCRLDFVVDLVEKHVDLGGSQFFWINSRTLVLCACFTTECGSFGIRKSMFGSFTIGWFMTQIVMINNGLLRSFTKCFISNIERSAFMNRTCLKTIWHMFSVFYTNESPRSLMCLVNVGILSVFRWTCMNYTRFNTGSLRSFWRIRFFVKRINIDFLRTGLFLFILHTDHVIPVNGSPCSFTSWV